MSIPVAHETCEQKRARDHGSRNTRSNLVSIHCRLTTASASKTFGEERIPESILADETRSPTHTSPWGSLTRQFPANGVAVLG